jgi:NAD(P)-dependent dehydrogenase (short-subunit alcohol dehydrogenase family)
MFSSTTQVTSNFTILGSYLIESFRAGTSGNTKGQKPSTTDVSAIRDCMEVNLIGQVQTTTTFLPLLRASQQAVILNVSSELASNSWQAAPNRSASLVAYSASKAALNSYTIVLAQELKKEGIKVNAATPGFTSSQLTKFNAYGKTTRQGAESLLPWALIDKDGPTCEYCYATDIGIEMFTLVFAGQFFDSMGGIMPW